MGLIQHDAVIATTGDPSVIPKIRKWIKEAGRPYMFHVGKQVTNGYVTVVMQPDGSKEGWETSDQFDKLREAFIALLLKSKFHVVRVSYGERGFSAQEIRVS
jgi:hypothetical protein